MNQNFRKPTPAYMEDAIRWVNSLTYPEIAKQIVIYHGYIKTYEDSYSNIIAFIPLIITIFQLAAKNQIISKTIILLLSLIGFILTCILAIIALKNKSFNLGYLVVSLPIIVGIQYLTQNPDTVIFLSFIMIAIYFFTLAHYKPKDLKNQIILALLNQRKSLIESSNPASKIRLPQKYNNIN